MASQWWIVSEPWPKAHPTGMTDFPYQGTKSDAQLQGVVVAGPFTTESAAQNWISGKAKSNPNGSSTTYSHVPPQTQAKIPLPKLPNPLSGIDQVGAVIESFYRAITDGKFWRSIGWVLLGIVLLIGGIILWMKKNNLIPNFVPLPV